MARYIDADKLLNERTIFIQDEEGFDIAVVAVADIELAPTADVAEVKHGEWKHTDEARYWAGKDECSECTYHYYDRRDLSRFNYCPYCGAKMDGGK